MTSDEPVRRLPALEWRVAGAQLTAIERAVPDEAPIGISYDSEPYAVLMATPAEIADLALGFTISERIAAAADVLDIRVARREGGVLADVLLSAEAARGVRERRRRNLEARSSCGLCGVETLEEASRTLPRLADGLTVAPAAIQAALDALEPAQALGEATRATHAAAWADRHGRLLLVREDVGRHNALDKLIGAAAGKGLDPGAAFILVTSRCSYEMVEKAAVAGVALLAAISAPTALAIRKAQAANMTLIALVRPDGHAVFTGGHRMQDEAGPEG